MDPSTFRRVHDHLKIGPSERDQWLTCMSAAIDAQPYAAEFKTYLKEQLSIPAKLIEKRCAEARESSAGE